MTDTLDQGRLISGACTAIPQSALNNQDQEPDVFKPLTRCEAQALRAQHRSTSPWIVLAIQALLGLILSGGFGLWQSSAGWSALYGVATVVVPGLVMARGMTRQSSTTPSEALLSFMLWEGAKVMLAVAFLVAAFKVVPGLNGLVLLLTMIVSLKVNWLVLLWHRPSTQKPEKTQQHVR
jgi:ATP synthase protein I